MSKWHCAIDGAKYGPVSVQDLRNWLAEGRLKSTDHVWTEGMPDWAPYNTVEELNSGIVVQTGSVVYVQGPGQIVPQQQGNGMAVAVHLTIGDSLLLALSEVEGTAGY